MPVGVNRAASFRPHFAQPPARDKIHAPTTIYFTMRPAHCAIQTSIGHGRHVAAGLDSFLPIVISTGAECHVFFENPACLRKRRHGTQRRSMVSSACPPRRGLGIQHDKQGSLPGVPEQVWAPAPYSGRTFALCMTVVRVDSRRASGYLVNRVVKTVEFNCLGQTEAWRVG
jgi:hypothetical protein